jgi:membrane-bound lytic murein transglycosylase B
VADLKVAARAAEISPEVIDLVLDAVEQSERVLELDRRQPEFTSTFADYFNRRVTEARVTRGRELLKTHQVLLETIRADTGVPPQSAVIWARCRSPIP